MFRDAVVECLNFRIESFQRSSTLDVVLARRRIFASRHSLDELFQVSTTDFIVQGMIDAVP
jgi:hypothetical protein